MNSCFGVTYNFYHRNELTGSYQIKKIGNISEKYRFSYSKKDNEIIGYYYDSSKVKFIDVVDGNKITKSTYYDKETGSVLYEKSFFYGEDSNIKSFLYQQMDESGNVVYEMRSFFAKENDKVIYNSSGFMTYGNFEQRVIVEGLLSKEYKPLEYKAYGIIIDDKNTMAQSFNTEEFFSYEKSCMTSNLYQNHKLYKSKKKFSVGKQKVYEEIIYNANEEQLGLKQYILEGSVLTQIMNTSSKTTNVYDYSKIDDCCCVLEYNDWDNSSALKIEISDEIVYVKNGVVETLKYPINLFDLVWF